MNALLIVLHLTNGASVDVLHNAAANSESAEPASHSSVQQDTLPAEQSNVPQVRENNAVSSRYQAEQAPHQQPVAESEPPPAVCIVLL